MQVRLAATPQGARLRKVELGQSASQSMCFTTEPWPCFLYYHLFSLLPTTSPVDLAFDLQSGKLQTKSFSREEAGEKLLLSFPPDCSKQTDPLNGDLSAKAQMAHACSNIGSDPNGPNIYTEAHRCFLAFLTLWE